jgi:hypothetical protein
MPSSPATIRSSCLQRVKHRVVTMHASDRFLIEGTLEDLRREEGGAQGYAKRLRAMARSARASTITMRFLASLRGVGFDSWISIEDGVDGMEQLAASTRFLRGKIAQHWPQ